MAATSGLALCAPRQGARPSRPGRVLVAASYTSRALRRGPAEPAAVAGMVLECAAQPLGGGGGAVAVQPQAAPASRSPGNTWELIYTRKSGSDGSSETPVLQAAPRRPTAAPATVAGQPGADPRLVRLTQQLIARAGRPAEMQALLAGQALEAADVRRLLTYLDRQGAADVALDAFHAMKPLPQFHTGGCWLCGKRVQAPRLLPRRGHRSLLPCGRAALLLVPTWCHRTRRFPSAADDPVLRTKLIKMHSRRPKDTAAALALYDEMVADRVAPDAVCYNTALGAAGAAPAGVHSRAVAPLSGMRMSCCPAAAAPPSHAARPALPGCRPPPLRHPACFTGLGQHWERVLSILEDMRAAGVPWDAFTCSALLSACQACGRWEQALDWFRQAQSLPGEARGDATGQHTGSAAAATAHALHAAEARGLCQPVGLAWRAALSQRNPFHAFLPASRPAAECGALHDAHELPAEGGAGGLPAWHPAPAACTTAP